MKTLSEEVNIFHKRLAELIIEIGRVIVNIGLNRSRLCITIGVHIMAYGLNKKGKCIEFEEEMDKLRGEYDKE